MIPGSLNRRVTPPSSREVMGEVEKRTPPRKLQTAPPGFPDGAACPWRFPRFYKAETREGSSTIEKRTPALWRFSSETARQASSASLRVLKGPCAWAEPSTSLWKFIDPNSPPITQKLLPVVMVSLLPALAELVHRIVGAARLQSGFTGEIFLVIVADIGASHVLMLCTGDALTDLLTLNILHIAQHALLAEILPREIVSRQSCRVIGRQRDQMVEDAGTLC